MAVSVSGLWIGTELSSYEWLCLASFADAGMDVNLYTFESSLKVPAGVSLADARDVVPESEVFENHDRQGTYAAFSDLFRYRLLDYSDTTWIDTDVLFIGRDLPAGEYVMGYEAPGVVNGAILRAPSGSPFLEYALQVVEAADTSTLAWGDIGPRLVTQAAFACGLEEVIQPTNRLYPIHFSKVWQLLDPSQCANVEARVSEASTIHLWNEVLRRHPPLKTTRPPRGSYLSNAFDRHGVAFACRDELSADWVTSDLRRRIDPSRSPIARALSKVRRMRGEVA
jgi:hypothetical protein